MFVEGDPDFSTTQNTKNYYYYFFLEAAPAFINEELRPREFK